GPGRPLRAPPCARVTQEKGRPAADRAPAGSGRAARGIMARGVTNLTGGLPCRIHDCGLSTREEASGTREPLMHLHATAGLPKLATSGGAPTVSPSGGP